MAVFVEDTFTVSVNTLLTDHTGEIGAIWSILGSGSSLNIAASSNSAYGIATTNRCYASGEPTSADYIVEADFVFIKSLGTPGICARCSTGVDQTFYYFRYFDGVWQLYSVIDNVFSLIGSTSLTVTPESYHVGLELVGDEIKCYVNDMVNPGISISNSDITEKGKAGIRISSANTNARIDNFTATDVGGGGATIGLSGTVDAIASSMGQINKSAGLSGVVAGVCESYSDVSVKKLLSGSVDATAGSVGQINVVRTLSGETAGQTNIAGILSVFRAMSGHVDASAEIQGQITLQGFIQLSGSVGVMADATGVISAKLDFSGNVGSTSDTEGHLSAIKRLSGMVDSGADIQGSVVIYSDDRIYLSGNVGAMSALESAINASKGLTGQVQAVAGIDGKTSVKLNLTGSANAIANAVGVFRIIGAGSLGVVIDPTINSLTTTRLLKSITTKYTIKSI